METGWRVDGRKAWLWAFAGEDATVYLVSSGRGYEDAKVILGEDFSDVLERDGSNRRFELAQHSVRRSRTRMDTLRSRSRRARSMAKVLTLGGNAGTVLLAIVRSLGRAGIEVHSAWRGRRRPSIDRASLPEPGSCRHTSRTTFAGSRR